MPVQFPTKEQRVNACRGNVTLNGLSAKVTGYNQPFATITQYETGLSCEWSWQTVIHIIENRGGKFQS